MPEEETGLVPRDAPGNRTLTMPTSAAVAVRLTDVNV
eukprot:CAMPEP_0118989494 /NCGR_PEP_ID=MMETSP1173-20130426/48144_1 /TAXON_ID=1034831 /ORGANISM="Rhizochromulina marina cf, Strain CCMP1243" /LENGTH=36 /DNA_ID= /DNA_START= /DNA_END= /DNA_ORIENTATION=